MSNKRIKKKHWKSNGGILNCALCGRFLWLFGDNYFNGQYGAVCHTCLRMGMKMIAQQQSRSAQADTSHSNQKALSANSSLKSPQEIIDQLDTVIAGQDAAKRTIALSVWKQLMRANGSTSVPAGHVLLHGPTGCGKTFLATQAAKMADIPYCVFDATTLSENGYKGRDAVDILKDYSNTAKAHPKYEYGMIILDEVDKLAARGSSDRQTYCRATQHCLLKMLEGTIIEEVDTTNLLFVLCGAFPDLTCSPSGQIAPIGFMRQADPPRRASHLQPDDFVAIGIERELMGRISGLAEIYPLTKKDLLHILLEKKDSVFRQYQIFFETQGIHLTLPMEMAETIAQQALSLGTGARALKSELDKVMEPLLFQLAAGDLKGDVEIRDLGLQTVPQQIRPCS